MEPSLLKDKDWVAIEDKLCLVTEFVPMAAVQGGEVASAVAGFPLASVSLRPDTGISCSGYITHKIDFMMLWSAFQGHTAVPGTRMEDGPQPSAPELVPLPRGMDDTVE